MFLSLQNDLDDDALNHDDDIRLESPDSGKNKENDLDQLTDAMDLEASENHLVSIFYLNV